MRSNSKLLILSNYQYSYIHNLHNSLTTNTYSQLEIVYVRVANMIKLSRLPEVLENEEQNRVPERRLVRTLLTQCDLRQFHFLSLVQS